MEVPNGRGSSPQNRKKYQIGEVPISRGFGMQQTPSLCHFRCVLDCHTSIFLY